MTTPICDFVKEYIKRNPIRLHMPGHKGAEYLGYECFDITEIDGADSLYEPTGIIMESEKNASEIFGSDTFYSTEGSSQCIKTMVYLAGLYAQKKGRKRLIYAARNGHRSFVSAVSLCDFEVKWLCSDNDDTYLSCRITKEYLDNELKNAEDLPVAVYITSPDYLGSIQDIKSLSEVCKKYDVLLLCDNAHGAYLKFLPESMHPIDLGADMCCDSAHKTLPALTGAAYLHLGKSVSEILYYCVRNAMALFGSTSPNYLILQSLDYLNKYLDEVYRKKLNEFIITAKTLKDRLVDCGYDIYGDEVLKLTLKPKSRGYTGREIAAMLLKKGVVCEFYDEEFVVLMLTPEIDKNDTERIFETLCSIEKRESLLSKKYKRINHIQKMSIRDAVMSESEEVSLKNACGRVLSQLTVSCPPAVIVVSPGEEITMEDTEILRSTGAEKLWVIK